MQKVHERNPIGSLLLDENTVAGTIYSQDGGKVFVRVVMGSLSAALASKEKSPSVEEVQVLASLFPALGIPES